MIFIFFAVFLHTRENNIDYLTYRLHVLRFVLTFHIAYGGQ
jgi:hypothetical protein